MAQRVKNLPAMRETQVQSLGQEDPLEKGMASHSSILAWEIPWIEEPGGRQSTVSQSQARLTLNSIQWAKRRWRSTEKDGVTCYQILRCNGAADWVAGPTLHHPSPPVGSSQTWSNPLPTQVPSTHPRGAQGYPPGSTPFTNPSRKPGTFTRAGTYSPGFTEALETTSGEFCERL